MAGSQGTVRSATSVDAWTSLVKAFLGVAGLALLAAAPFVDAPAEFRSLPHYAYAVGGLLVVAAATMRLRSMLVVVACLAFTAGLGLALAGDPGGRRVLAALLLYGGSALLFGAVARRAWAALPFLLVPLLVVAPHGDGWAESREAFTSAWQDALGCECLLAGLPAALAVAGAALGQATRQGWPRVRPSALPLLLLCGGLVLAGLVVGTLLPAARLDFYQAVAWRAALLAGVLGWVAFAYQMGRVALVWQAALACLVLLAGALFLDRGTQFPEDVGATLALTVATSLVPAVLAGAGLLARSWIGTERPRHAAAASPAPSGRRVDERSFFAAPPPPEAVLPTPLATARLEPREPATGTEPSPEPEQGDDEPDAKS